MPLKSYRELNVWEKAMDLAVACYETTRAFPKEELFGLTSQIRRAAASVPANIAEGHSRPHTKEYARFLGIARGSVSELETHLLLATRIRLLEQSWTSSLLSQTDEISRMIAGILKALRRRT